MEVFPTNDGCDISTQQAQKDFTSLGHALLHTGCDLPLLLLLVGFSENKFRREHSETIDEADIPETLQESLLFLRETFRRITNQTMQQILRVVKDTGLPITGMKPSKE